MANEEHLAILRQGVRVWNKWREEHPEVQPKFIKAGHRVAEHRVVDFSGADLRLADLKGADLRLADLKGADLRGVDLFRTDFRYADLSGADLSGANLGGTDLSLAKLNETNLSETTLRGVHFREAILSNTIFRGATLSSTTFADVDLSQAQGLTEVDFNTPCTIGLDTIYKSGGNIPESFLRGAGVPDSFITYMKSLVGKPFDYYSCFISYSSLDQEVAERLYADLQAAGVRCWYDREDIKIGDHIRKRIDEAIRIHDKLLLILSEHSINSAWVEDEVEAAFERESREGREMLFPVRVDDAVMETDQAWAANLRRTRHIGDLCAWKDHDRYKKTLDRLLRDLKGASQ